MKTCAVIVTYYPDVDKLKNLIGDIQNQVLHTLVIDNTPEKKNRLHLLGNPEGMTLIQNGKNIGLSKAQNIGIKWMRSHEYDYVLILDQDSQPSPDMVNKLISASKSLKGRGVKLAAVGPKYGRGGGDSFYFLRFGKYRYERLYCSEKPCLIECSFLISSGMLISAEALCDIGMMDESLFIDHIDTEWCLRAMSKGYVSYGVCDAFMRHELGEKVVHVWWGRDRNISVHHAFRLYYIFRNSILLYKRKYLPVRWKIFDLKRLAFFPILYLLYSDEKLLSLKYMALGIFHGLLGRTGKLRD